MRMNLNLKSMLLGALCATVMVLSVAAAVGDRTEWEYRVVTGGVLRNQGTHTTLEHRINGLASEGWQFVSASGVGEASGFAVMRRPKP